MVSTYTNPVYEYRRHPDQEAATPAHHPVIIVGGGPTGLYMALDFARQGIATVVLDNDSTVSFGSRALCFSKRTLEILDRVGCGEPVAEKGVTWQLGKVFFHQQQVYEFNLLPEQGHQRPAFVNIQQYYPEEYLVNTILETPAVSLRWLNTVKQVRRTGERVEVVTETPDGEYRMTCDYVLVADGANSGIRESLGLESQGQIFDDTFLIADIAMQADFPTERWFWFDPPFWPGQSVLLHRQPDGIWRIDFQLGPNADRDEWKQPEKVRPLIEAMLGDVPFEFEWLSVYRFRCRRMDSFIHEDRILFVGDSAHQVSPFGARGANGALQSAENLVWKLARILRGTAPATLLDTYDEERSHGADENILNSTRATDFITPKNRVTRLFRDTVLELAQEYPFARSLINSGRLSVPCTYENASLSTPDDPADGFPAEMRPGSVCKDAPVRVLVPASDKSSREPWLLRHLGERFVALVAVGKGGMTDTLRSQIETLQALDDLDVVVIDNDQVPAGVLALADEQHFMHARLALQPGTTYLFRPDQHVAARWRSLDVTRVQAAMQHALGRPAKEVK